METQTTSGRPIAENQATSPSKEQMIAALDISGYLLEHRISGIMQGCGFRVQPNYFAQDPNDSNKTIEVDVLALSVQRVKAETDDYVYAAFLIECKNNSQPVVFFDQCQQVPENNVGRIFLRGIPVSSKGIDGRPLPLQTVFNMHQWHHYCKPTVLATQFCSFKGDRQGSGVKAPVSWKAEAMEQYSKSFSNLAAATYGFSKEPAEEMSETIQLGILYAYSGASRS